MLSILGTFFGVAVGFVTCVYAVRKLWLWCYPVKVEAWWQMTCDGSKPDVMGAKVTNRRPDPVYLRSCVVRGTYPLSHLALYHLRHPFIRPRLYQNVWYNGAVYNLMGDVPVKIEAQQLINLEWGIYEHPLNAMYTPQFVAIAKLTSGRVIRSRRVPAPAAWRLIGRRRVEQPA